MLIILNVATTEWKYRGKLLCFHRIDIVGKLVVLDVFNARGVCGCSVSGHRFLQQPSSKAIKRESNGVTRLRQRRLVSVCESLWKRSSEG